MLIRKFILASLLFGACLSGCDDGATVKQATPLEKMSVNGIALEPTPVLDGKVNLLLPSEFTVMSEEMLRIKYPTSRAPSLVYTNDKGTVNVAFNHTQTRIGKDNLDEYLDQMDQTFRTIYPSAVWHESGMFELNGKEWIMLDLQTQALDTDIRNVMAGTALDGRLLIVTFNCTIELEDQWIEAGKSIMSSMQIDP